MNEKGNEEIKEDALKNDTVKEEETVSDELEESEETVSDSEMTLEESLGVIEELKGELNKCQKEKEEITVHLQRLQAEFDNFRKRTRKEKEEITKNATMGLIEETLPIIDNFERALETGKEQFGENSFYEGVKMIYNGLMGIMSKNGLQSIEAVGSQFDPNIHQAVMQVEASDEYPENTVVEEMQKGYTLNNKILRPAMVKVSKS